MTNTVNFLLLLSNVISTRIDTPVFNSVVNGKLELGETSTLNISNEEFSTKAYFKNLDNNSLYNVGNSCGFVALAQYLSYLDTFYNDDIINDSFEIKSYGTSIEEVVSESPGVLNLNWDISSVGNLRSFINSNMFNDYGCYLMEFYSYHTMFMGDNDPERTSIGLRSYQAILDELALYGTPQLIFNTKMVNLAFGDHYKESNIEMFDSLIKEKLDDGEPVILNIANKDRTFNHAVVAYYYDSSGKIHCNYGWKTVPNATDMTLDEDHKVYGVVYRYELFE
ncbi:MAG: C10 family peptidase [Firmicutes bacterium]|uniref:C10 family peptidase n=1 Tax=Candidatus Onthovivens merdipullorum TaxID=2840889 RepID=A0A9D9DNB3_9BACL|nr:C10 family peptidase [Candidatus Onthovivens merdipullorum]